MSQTFLLHRPETANAFDIDTARRLKKELSHAVKNGETSFLISSKTENVFCSGGDLKFYSKLKKKSDGVSVNREIRKILSEFKKLPIFIAASVEGDTVGGGCELALACDFIFASRKARFAFKQINQNLTPGWGGAKPLLHRVGQSKFLDWLSSGKWITASEAFASGLVDDLNENGQVLKKIEDFFEARRLSPRMISSLKEMAYNEATNEGRIFEKFWWSKPHLEELTRVLKK